MISHFNISRVLDLLLYWIENFRLRSACKPSFLDGVIVQPRFFADFDYQPTLPFVFYPDVTSLVSKLLPLRGPAHVTWFVVAVRIWKTVNGIAFFWLPSHVSQEGRKVMKPLRADFNPPTAIVLPVCVIRIRASLNHTLPRVVFGRSMVTVNRRRDSPCFHIKTTARSSRTRPQRIEVYRLHGSAVATTFDAPDERVDSGRLSDNNHAAISFSRLDDNEIWHTEPSNGSLAGPTAFPALRAFLILPAGGVS